MSHVRNLFAKPSGYGREAPKSFAERLPEEVTEIPAPPHLAEAPVRLEFPVEEARIRPETRLIVHTDPRGTAADRFRLARMRLRELRNVGTLNSLLVTSPLANEGKSTVVMNLASVLSERGKRPILVVEADLHHPCLVKTLGLEAWAGLTSCLQNDLSPLSAIRRVEPLGWCLLPAGETRRNPTELLQTPAFGNLMQRLAPHFEWILIDSPPVVPLTDSISLQHHADGTLVVIRAEQTPREAIEQAVALLGRKKICAVILNGIEADNQPRPREQEREETMYQTMDIRGSRTTE